MPFVFIESRSPNGKMRLYRRLVCWDNYVFGAKAQK